MWKTKKLGEVCEMIKRGVAPKYIDEGGIGVLNQKCIRNHSINLEPSRRHNIEIKKVAIERYIRAGDVLVNSTGTGTLGRVAQVREEPVEPTTVDTHVTIVRPKSELFFNDFFGYMLIKIENAITESGEGASGQTELARSKLESEFDVSYPISIAEQQRAVAILDEAFAGIDVSISNTQANLASARELFESYINNIFVQKGEGWVEKKLGDVCEKITDGTHQTPKYFDEGYVFLSSRNVKSRQIDWKNIKYIDHAQHIALQKRLSPKFNDILLAKNGTTGVAAIVDRDDVIFDIYVSLALLRSKGEVLPRFLLHFVNSPVAKAQFNKRLKGAGVPNLHLKEIREVLIGFPSSNTEQSNIVKNIDAFMDKTQRLEATYQRKLDALAELKQSILAKAFSGELTRQEAAA